MKLKKWLRMTQELGFKVTIEPITNVKASAFVEPDCDDEPVYGVAVVRGVHPRWARLGCTVSTTNRTRQRRVTYQRGYRANGRGGHGRRGGVGRKVPTGTTAPRP